MRSPTIASCSSTSPGTYESRNAHHRFPHRSRHRRRVDAPRGSLAPRRRGVRPSRVGRRDPELRTDSRRSATRPAVYRSAHVSRHLVDQGILRERASATPDALGRPRKNTGSTVSHMDHEGAADASLRGRQQWFASAVMTPETLPPVSARGGRERSHTGARSQLRRAFGDLPARLPHETGGMSC